jgi:hypothetical protein
MQGKYEKSRILIARQHFSMALLWGQLHRDFLRFVNWSQACGRWGNFYQVAHARPAPVIMRSFDWWEPRLSKKYRVDRGYYNILGSTIFKLFKSRVCRAAQLLGGFRRDLLIVTWAATTPGCTANFLGNRYSQPLILRPFGRSGRELHLEYQVETVFINFSVSW